MLGKDHPDTLQSRNNLASAYRAVGRVEQAITLYEQLLTDSIRILGETHPLIANVTVNLREARMQQP